MAKSRKERMKDRQRWAREKQSRHGHGEREHHCDHSSPRPSGDHVLYAIRNRKTGRLLGSQPVALAVGESPVRVGRLTFDAGLFRLFDTPHVGSVFTSDDLAMVRFLVRHGDITPGTHGCWPLVSIDRWSNCEFQLTDLEIVRFNWAQGGVEPEGT